MAELELKAKRWEHGFVELDFGFDGPEVMTARLERDGAEPAFPPGTPLRWCSALENWCDAHEQLLNELTMMVKRN
jgi:hypothetical protein